MLLTEEYDVSRTLPTVRPGHKLLRLTDGMYLVFPGEELYENSLQADAPLSVV